MAETSFPTKTEEKHPAPLLNEKQAAQLLGLSLRTLQDWRWKRVGPRFLKLGGSVRYRVADLEDFVERSAVQTDVAAAL